MPRRKRRAVQALANLGDYGKKKSKRQKTDNQSEQVACTLPQRDPFLATYEDAQKRITETSQSCEGTFKEISQPAWSPSAGDPAQSSE